jgi:hypothetical protein
LKVWTSNAPKDDKIILHHDKIIYKCNPKPAEVENTIQSFSMGIIPQQGVFGIPISYINEVRWQEGKDYIQVFFRGSEEYLTIQDAIQRQEIFEYFKTILPSFRITTQHFTRMQAGKKPLIALGVLSLLFLGTLFFYWTMENGVSWELGYNPGVFSILIGLAAIGLQKFLLLYFVLFAVAGSTFYFKTKKPLVIHRVIK